MKLQSKLRQAMGSILVAGLFLVQGCAHGRGEKELDQKVAANPVETPRELHAQATQEIESAPGLKPEQKAKLLAIRDSVRKEMSKDRVESLRLRSVLIQDLVQKRDTQKNRKEIELVKKKIRDLEEKKLSAFFQAVREANETMGRWGSRDERLAESMLYDEMETTGFR